MHIKSIILFLLVCITIAGCAGSPYMIENATPEELENVSTKDLIHGYNHMTATTPFSKYEPKSRTPTVKAELQRRNLVPEHEWETIDQRKIKIGLSEMGLYISWGFPDKVNKSVGSYGVHKQIIYKRGKHSKTYVYVENGKVTSWQN